MQIGFKNYVEVRVSIGKFGSIQTKNAFKAVRLKADDNIVVTADCGLVGKLGD